MERGVPVGVKGAAGSESVRSGSKGFYFGGMSGRGSAGDWLPAHGANKNTIAGIASCPEEEEKLKRSPKEAYGKSFVQKGYIVFCPDPPGYGERVERVPLEDASFLGNSRRNPLGASCKNLAQTAEALGLSLTGLILWDLQRLLDFACACSQTDTDRITCAGFSGGGQYTMWLAAMDDRIHTAVISGYVHGYYTMMLETHLCPCNYAPDLWRLGDISDICSMIAPRPLFIETGIQDIENGPEGIQNPIEQVSKIRAAYRIFGKEELVEHCIFEGPHMWYGGYFSGIKS